MITKLKWNRKGSLCFCVVFILNVVNNSLWVFAEMHFASDVCSAAFTEGRSGFCGCIFHVSDRVALPLNVPQSKQAVSSVWKEIF